MSLVETMGVRQGVRHARKHVAAYAEEAGRLGAMIDRAELAEILQSDDPERLNRFLVTVFSGLPLPNMGLAA